MGARKLLFLLKQKVSFIFLKSKDTIIRKTTPPPIIKSIEETFQKIIKERCSVCRYGDGELDIIIGKDVGFQPSSVQLSERLKDILISSEENIIICLPDVFISLTQYNKTATIYWEHNLVSKRFHWYKLIDKKKIYYNAFMTRLYLDFKDKNKCAIRFEKLKEIWDSRDIIIVEGDKSRVGVGNDLFINARSIVRILAPAEDAFSKYTEILDEVNKQDITKLILIALGPTATILAYDLHKNGYQAIDLGHADIEYEWFLRNVSHKIKIENKYVNEVQNGQNISYIEDEKYLSEIIKVIK